MTFFLFSQSSQIYERRPDATSRLIGTVSSLNPVQFSNAFERINVTLSGSVRDVSEEQSSKALSPMVVNVSGKVMDSNEVQPWKAHVSIIVTDFGIVIDLTLLHSYSLISTGN